MRGYSLNFLEKNLSENVSQRAKSGNIIIRTIAKILAARNHTSECFTLGINSDLIRERMFYSVGVIIIFIIVPIYYRPIKIVL